MIPIGVVMRRAREMRRLTQRQLAEAMGTTQPSVSAWEVGAVIPNTRTLRRCAEVLGFQMQITFTPVELVDEDAYPWSPKVVWKEPTFGYGPVEEEL